MEVNVLESGDTFLDISQNILLYLRQFILLKKKVYNK